jgi:glutamyl-Q tRNA(Asp) synthetase
MYQSARSARYNDALQRLREAGWAYPCGCSRQDIDAALLAQGARHRPGTERVYPGTCRAGLHGKPARAWRMRCATSPHADAAPLHIAWHDRRLGAQTQDVTHEVGDFVLRRGDGLFAYQLAVVVDDAEQGITDVVRGEDLADNTPRQIHLQRCLGLPTPRHLHLPLVLGADGHKLSKHNGAAPLDLREPLPALRNAAAVLGLHVEAEADTTGAWLAGAVCAWRSRWMA